MSEPIIENDETVTSVNAPAKSPIVEKTVTPVVAPVQPKKGYSMFDNTAGAVKSAVTTVVEKSGIGGVRPDAITGVKKTYTEDMVPGSMTVSKREVFVDKKNIQPYVKTESIFQKSNPAMVKTVEKMVGFRTKNTQGDGYSPFPENATYQDKIDRMNYMGALQYVYKLPSGSIAPYHDIPYETEIAKLIEAPKGYNTPSIGAIALKTLAPGGAFNASGDATDYDDKKVSITNKDQGRFPEWIPLIGGDKIGVTLDQALGTNFDEVGFNLQIARQYNKILIKAGLNSRQRLAIITERSENKFKNLENIFGYARRGVRFAVETGGYLIGESYDILTDDESWAGGLGIKDSKKRNDFYDLILDKQANILQDGYAARGIEIDIGTAEILATMFTSTPQRLAAVASEILIPSGAMTNLVVGLSKRELKKFKSYHLKIKMKPGQAEQTVEDSLKTFQEIRNKQFFGINLGDVPYGVGATYQKLDKIMNGGRLVRGMQLDDAAQTVFKRPEVSAAISVRRNILKQRNDYVESVRITGKRTLANEKQIAKLNNSLNLATQNVRTIVLESNLPSFIRDIASGNKAMIIGASSFGQLAQDQNFLNGEGDSQLIEAVGLFAGIAYDLGSNNRTISGLLRRVYHFTNASKRDFDFAEELAKRVNTFSPKFKATLEKRIQYIDGIQQNLIAENPNLEPLVKLSFAKLSGLAILQGIEEGARLNISEKSIASFGQTVEDLQQVVDLKSTLLNELASTAQSISDVRRGGDTPALQKFQNTIDKAYESAKKRNDELQDTIEQLKQAQKNEITDFIKGTKGKLDDGVSSADISTKLNNMYAMNNKSIDWTNEFNISDENQKISDSIDKAIEDKAKTLNKTALMKDANKKTNKILKKDESPTVEYDNVGDLLLTFSENVRNKSSSKVSQEYLKLDSSKFITKTGELIGTEAKVEGIGILDKFIKLIGKNNDTDVLKELAGSNIGKSKQANLFKALDNAAGTTVQKHFDTVNVNGQFENINEFVSSILENAPPGTIKTFLPVNLQVVDVINQTMKKGGKTIDSIPISFSQLKEMNSAFSNLGSKYKKLQESGSTTAGGIFSDYIKLKDETEDMFGKFKVNFGEKNEQLIGNMFVEIGKERVPVKVLLDRAKTMHQTHKSRFFDNSKNWDKAFNGRNKVEPNNIRPTGITLENNPNEWFNFDEIADMNSAQLSEFQGSFFEFLGSIKGQELVIDTGSQNGKALKALMQLKLSDYVSDLAKSGKINSPEYITKLKNLEVAFKMGRKDGKLESLIDVRKAEKDLYGFNPASVGDELWKRGHRNLEQRMKKLGLDTTIKPATEYLDQRRQVQRVLQNIGSQNAPTMSLAQRVFENGGQLKTIKKGLKEFYGNRVSNDRIDKLVRDVYLEDLNENVFMPTGRMVANHKGEIVQEITMSLEVLKAVTGFGSAARRSQVESIIGKKRLAVFDNMIAFCAEESAAIEKTSNITGIPRHFSVESYISRFYSINRGVISARYVGTEAVLQQFRMRGHNLFKALVENPEAGQLFLEIVKTGQPLSRQKEIVMFNVLTQALNYQDKINAQSPEREITLPEGWKIKYREYDNVNNT